MATITHIFDYDECKEYGKKFEDTKNELNIAQDEASLSAIITAGLSLIFIAFGAPEFTIFFGILGVGIGYQGIEEDSAQSTFRKAQYEFDEAKDVLNKFNDKYDKVKIELEYGEYSDYNSDLKETLEYQVPESVKVIAYHHVDGGWIH
jgi:hypothetical protein